MATRPSSAERLNTPGPLRRRLIPRLRVDNDSFGAFAEGFARFMGTARFLAWMTVIIVVWIVGNVLAGAENAPDYFPFIFLTLLLSLQASYAAPLILLAQNRQEARDRITAEADRRQAAQARADTDYLAREIASLRMSVGELATRDFIRNEIRGELRALLAELDDEDGGEPPRETNQRRPERRPAERRRPRTGTSVDSAAARGRA